MFFLLASSSESAAVQISSLAKELICKHINLIARFYYWTEVRLSDRRECNGEMADSDGYESRPEKQYEKSGTAASTFRLNLICV